MALDEQDIQEILYETETTVECPISWSFINSKLLELLDRVLEEDPEITLQGLRDRLRKLDR